MCPTPNLYNGLQIVVLVDSRVEDLSRLKYFDNHMLCYHHSASPPEFVAPSLVPKFHCTQPPILYNGTGCRWDVQISALERPREPGLALMS